MTVRGQFPFTVIGHRGCAGVEPENTLRGVHRAIDMGCPMVEIDVHVLGGRLIVIHDEKVDRTTDGRGVLEKFKLEELRKLDAGLGEKIPYLEEVLEMCAGKCQLNIELKGKGSAEAVVEVLERWGPSHVVISSFEWNWLETVRKLDEVLDISVLVSKSYLLDAAILQAKKLRAVSVNPSLKILSEAFCDKVHAQDMLVYTYTVKEDKHLKYAQACGADGCFADFPDAVLKELR